MVMFETTGLADPAPIMKTFQQPEIMRVPLEEVILQIKLRQLGSISEFLLQALDPPPQEMVERGVQMLQELHALTRPSSTLASPRPTRRRRTCWRGSRRRSSRGLVPTGLAPGSSLRPRRFALVSQCEQGNLAVELGQT